MALICPACKRRYEGDNVFCEDCGTSLQPGRVRWRKWAILGVGAVCVFAGLWIGVTVIENDVRNNVTVTVNSYNFDAAMRVLRVPVEIRNNSSVSLRVDSVTCRATIFATTVRCLQADLPTEVPRGEVVNATLSIAIASAPHGTAGSSVEVPEVALHAWGIPIDYRVNTSNLINLSAVEIDNILNPGRTRDVEPQTSTCCDPPPPPRRKRSSGETAGVFHEEKEKNSTDMKEAKDLARKAVSKVKDMSQMGGNQ